MVLADAKTNEKKISSISSLFIFCQLGIFYQQLLVSIGVPGKKYMEVHQELSKTCFQLAVYQHHVVPFFYTIILFVMNIHIRASVIADSV